MERGDMSVQDVVVDHAAESPPDQNHQLESNHSGEALKNEEHHDSNEKPSQDELAQKALKEMANLRSFLHHDNAHVRKEFYKNAAQTSVGMIVALLVYLVVLFGSQWNTAKYWPNIDTAIAQTDSPGPWSSFIVGVLNSGIPGKRNFNWQPTPTSLSFTDASNAVDHGDYHMLVYIPSSFSTNVNNALNSSINTGSYVYTNPVYVILDEGRQYSLAITMRTVYYVLMPVAGELMGEAILQQAVASGVNMSALADLSVFSKPIQVTETNLHPVMTSGYSLATGFVFTMLLVFSSILANALPKIIEHARDRVWMRDIMRIRISLGLIIPAFMALVPAIIVAAGANDPNNDTEIFCQTFAAYWALLYLTMTVFTSVVILSWYIGPAGPLLLVVFMMLNIASSDVLVAVDLSPSFYKIGYGLPMYNAVVASRTVMFCSYNRLGQTIGVLIAWLIGIKIVNYFAAKRHDIFGLIRHQQKYRRHVEMKRISASA